VEHVPAGKIRIMVMPQSFDMDDEYGFVWGAVAEAKAGEVTELPPIKMVKRRTDRQGRGGDLGFKIKEGDAEKEFHEIPLEVAFIRPGGPAAQTDLKVGDIITAVDGHDVSGENHYLYPGLTHVPEGTTLSFTLERGATVKITAGKPL
jgi:S1-C subfamily serine protease